jgi:hypothetical protein
MVVLPGCRAHDDAERPLRVAIVRTPAEHDADAERALRELVGALRDAVADLAATTPARVALVRPWQALCAGTAGACTPPTAADVADVSLVASAQTVADGGLRLRVAYVAPEGTQRPSVVLALPRRSPREWAPAVRQALAGLGAQLDPERIPVRQDEGIRLLRAALAGTTVELTRPTLGPAPAPARPAAPAVPEDILRFLDDYGVAWASRASGQVRALHSAMSAGQRRDVERYFELARGLEVTFSDVDVVERDGHALLSMWRTDTVTTAGGERRALRTRIDVLLQRFPVGWLVVDQSRPPDLAWASDPVPPSAPPRRVDAVAADTARVAPPPTPAPLAATPRWTTLPRWTDPPVDARGPRARGLSLREIESLASEDGDGDRARFARTVDRPWVLMTEAPAPDARDLAARLGRVYADVVNDFPFLPKPANPSVVLVFATETRDRRFWRALERRVGLSFSEPSMGVRGHAVLGIGTTWWSDDVTPATLLRICLHEAVHALMHQMLDIGRTPSWLAEGIASRYDARALGLDLGPHVRALVEEGTFPTLDELMTPDRIPAHGYVPVALLVDWLLADPLRRSQLPVLYRPLHAMSMARLEDEWRRWVAVRYGAAP